MDHVAIMKKEWGLLQKIVDGTKKIESRWYLHKAAPWDKIKPNDAIYFKNSGEPVTVTAKVKRVIQLSDLDSPTEYQKPLFPESDGVISVGGLSPETILDLFAGDDGIEIDQIPCFLNLFKDKKYCLLIFLQNVQTIEPFNIDKTGFGAMSAWLTIDNINRIIRKD